MPSSSEPVAPAPVRIGFTPLTWVVLAIFAILLLGSLGTLVVLIDEQRAITRDQRAIADRQFAVLTPLVRESRPLVRRTLEGLPRTRAIATRSDRLVRTATPLLHELTDAGLVQTTGNVGVLVEQLLAGDLPATLRSLNRIAPQLDEAPAALRSVRQVSDALLQQQRLSRLMRSAITVLGQVRRSHLVTDADLAIPHVVRTLDESLAVQRQTLRVTQRTLAVTQQTLDVGRQTLTVARDTQGHAASIDRKLGGPLLGTGG